MRTTVVGAGVIGLSCAYELTELGHTVTVIDAGEVGAGASAGNAGWVTPFLSTPRAAPGAIRDAFRSFTSSEGPARMRPHLEPSFATWVTRFLRASTKKRSAKSTAALQEFARHAHDHFDSLLERGVAFDEYRDGLAVVFKEKDNLRHYERTVTKMRALGYVGSVRIYHGDEAATFDPSLRRGLAGAIHLEAERHVRPETLCQGLAKAIENNGGEVIEHDAVDHVAASSSGQWQTSAASGRTIVSDNLVVAAGYPTRKLLAPLGVKVPLEAAKGTSMTASGHGIAPVHPLKLYENMVACSPFNTAVRLSGTFDIGNRDFSLSHKRLDMVMRQGLNYLEDWRPTNLEVEWVGHRPTSADDLPIIGPVPGHAGLYLATGHGTLGVTLGPVTGALAAQEIARGVQQRLLEPFRLSRF